MRFATFTYGGRTTWGVIDGNNAVDLGGRPSVGYADLKSAIVADALAAVGDALAGARRIPLDAITWQPVVPNPDKIICLGLNFEMHRQETGRSVVPHPTIFGRFTNTQIGHLESILRPRISSELDYEGELAIVIGKRGRYVGRDVAMHYVAGYACYNEATVRDFQYHTHQFTPGKNFPRTGAFGPWLMTPAELGPLDDLRIRTRVNGEEVQNATVSQMIFDIPRQIEYCSSFTWLEPGDVIVTGTPGGVGAKRNPPRWLAPGDVVEVEIDRLGTLRNTVCDEPDAAVAI